MPSLRLAAALAYAKAGIPVFPCRPNTKQSAIKAWDIIRTSEDSRGRTTDEATIQRWWSEADYNVAIVPEDAGWGVIDVDPKNGGVAPDIATRIVETPSGGQHLYFHGSLPPSVGKLGPGLDTRGRGSYVLIPPSVINGKLYIDRGGDILDLPEWIGSALAATTEAREAVSHDLDTPEAIAEARRWLALQAPAVEGNASDTFFRHAAWLKDYGVSKATATELLLDHNPGYAEDDIATRVANAFKYGQNEPGSNMPLPDAVVFANVEMPEISAIARPMSWWIDREFPKASWLWENLIVEKHANLITGKARVGKTTFLVNLIAHMLAGKPFMDIATVRRPVVAFMAEDHYGDVRDKLRSVLREINAPDSVLDNLHLRCTLDEPLDGNPYLAQVLDNGTVYESHFFREGLAPYLKQFDEPPLLIIDPIKSFIAFNPYSDMSARKLVETFLNRISRIGQGVTPLLTDHPSTNSGREGRDVAGSVQMEASFPVLATLKAGLWKGALVRQREMIFEMKYNRYAVEARPIKFYRIAGKFAYSQQGAAGYTAHDRMTTVYRHILERFVNGELCNATDRAGAYGPTEIAHFCEMETAEAKMALKSLETTGWLQYVGGKSIRTHYERGPKGPELHELEDAAPAPTTDPF